MLHQCSAPLHWPQVRPIIFTYASNLSQVPLLAMWEWCWSLALDFVFPSLHLAGPDNPTMTGM